MWNLKKKKGTNEPVYKTEVQLWMQKTNMWLPGYKGGGINWEIGIDIYTLLYIKYITNIDSYLFSLYIAQGTLLNTLQWPIWKKNLKKKNEWIYA